MCGTKRRREGKEGERTSNNDFSREIRNLNTRKIRTKPRTDPISGFILTLQQMGVGPRKHFYTIKQKPGLFQNIEKNIILKA